MSYAAFRLIEHGDIFSHPSDVLVAPVNCQPGVMGAGLALAFAQKFPGLRLRHRECCLDGSLAIGKPKLVRSVIRAERVETELPLEFGYIQRDFVPTNVVLFPTKDRPYDRSKLSWIWRGLGGLYTVIESYSMDLPCTISFPALGCGLGLLPFGQVHDVIQSWSRGLPNNFTVLLFAPHERKR
jgi:hypothetical protein